MKYVNSEQIARERARLDALIKKLQADRAKLDELERLAASLTENFGTSVSVTDAPVVRPGPVVTSAWPNNPFSEAIVQSNLDDEREGAAIAVAAPQKRDLPSRKTSTDRSALSPNYNRPYTQEQVETLRAARPADLAKLAGDWGRTASGLEKKREELLAEARQEAAEKALAPAVRPNAETISEMGAERRGEGADFTTPDALFADLNTPAEPDTEAMPEEEPPVSEQATVPKEDLPISSPRSDINEGSGDQGQRAGQSESRFFDSASAHEWRGGSNRTAKPGTPVRGLMDNGPKDPRILDQVAFSSKN